MSGAIHDVVYDDVVPMIEKADNPGLAMREWLVNGNIELKDVIEVCVALAITVRDRSDRCATGSIRTTC